MTSSSALAASAIPVVIGILLGVVQGVTEWIPVSSKTQLIIISTRLLRLEFGQSYALSLALESSSLLAAIIYFRRDLWKAIRLSRGEDGARLMLFLLVATCSTGAVGVPLYLLVQSVHVGPISGPLMTSLGVALLVEAAILYKARESHGVRTFGTLKVRDWVVIGAAQGIAALPGVSRSGVTISAMLFIGVRPDEALRLSYLLYIPAVIGASVAPAILTPEELLHAVHSASPLGLLSAFVAGATVSVFAIRWLIEFARRSKVYVITSTFGAIALAYGVFLTLVA